MGVKYRHEQLDCAIPPASAFEIHYWHESYIALVNPLEACKGTTGWALVQTRRRPFNGNYDYHVSQTCKLTGIFSFVRICVSMYTHTHTHVRAWLTFFKLISFTLSKDDFKKNEKFSFHQETSRFPLRVDTRIPREIGTHC